MKILGRDVRKDVSMKENSFWILYFAILNIILKDTMIIMSQVITLLILSKNTIMFLLYHEDVSLGYSNFRFYLLEELIRSCEYIFAYS